MSKSVVLKVNSATKRFGGLLAVNNLNKHFGGLHAVNDVSFSVEQGMIKAIIGPNGAGKTTLFNLIAGNLPANSGTIHFNNMLLV